jgi:hypothetical protein
MTTTPILNRLRALSAAYDTALDALKLAAKRDDAKAMDAASSEADAIAHETMQAVEELLLTLPDANSERNAP